MKNYNKILEAINKGIQLALDDYQDIEDNNSIFRDNDVIDTKDIIGYKVLLNKFKSFIAQNIYDPEIPLFMSIEEFNEFKDISLKFNIKYKFTKKHSLITAIRNISHFVSDANLNFFDVSNITDMSWLFHHSGFNGDISVWDVSNVINMNYMFGESNFNGDISKWNVSKVKHMNRTFEDAWEFNQDISNWDVSNVTDITNMFFNAKRFDQDISNWNLQHIESDTQCMHVFDGCPIKNEHKPKFKCKWKSDYQLVESNHLNLSLDDFENIEDNDYIASSDIIDVEDIIKQKIELNKITVDLGLPSGTLWCKYNLGSSNLTIGDAGNYYAWGETQPKEIYTWDTYEHGYGPYDLYKYIDNSDNAADDNNNKIDKLMVLQPEDDAATQNMHLCNFKFHIPTKEQFEELIQYTGYMYKPWSDEPKTAFGGAWFISKINGKKVFFPFKSLKGVDNAFFGGYYWSSTLKEGQNNNAYHMLVGSEFVKVEHFCERHCGIMLIRPVVNLN